jgi:hypothetical protein
LSPAASNHPSACALTITISSSRRPGTCRWCCAPAAPDASRSRARSDAEIRCRSGGARALRHGLHETSVVGSQLEAGHAAVAEIPDLHVAGLLDHVENRNGAPLGLVHRCGTGGADQRGGGRRPCAGPGEEGPAMAQAG